MNIWRLIAHHYDCKEAIILMKDKSKLAIGWSGIGDINDINPSDASVIAKKIKDYYQELNNSHTGGPTLWYFFNEVKIGDYVIVNVDGQRDSVFQIDGDYFFSNEEDAILNYRHQRNAILTDINAEELWNSINGEVDSGHNLRWTFTKLKSSNNAQKKIYFEGKRYNVESTGIERNRKARDICLNKHGYSCKVCGFNFKSEFGELGENYIHVHHINPISTSKSEYEIDPEIDLIPLCPNCHAMIHRKKEILSVDDLINIKELNKM